MNDSTNPFAVAAHSSQAVAVAQSRAAQEIQASLVVAKKFPRDQNFAYQQIIEACKRRGLAEEATYVYPRGGTTITGASIRLLEVIAQCWGNFNCGVIELEQTNGESQMMAYAWDLQTNFYDSKTFVVPHERKAGGKVEKILDPRDIYEHTANLAARRKRACMEAVIPRDIIDDAVAQCEKTLKSNSEPIADRIRKMVLAFADFGVNVAMMEKRLGHKLEASIEQELVTLRKIYTSLKDGMAKREDWFDVNAGAEMSRPTFEGDEKAEAAAGLAPQQQAAAPAPTAAQPKRTRQRRQEAQTMTEPAQPVVSSQSGAGLGTAPAPQPTSQPPVPPTQPSPAAAKAPGPSATTVPVASTPQAAAGEPAAATGGELFATESYRDLRAHMEQSQVTDVEVVAVCKQARLMAENQDELLQLSDDRIESIIQQWPAVASQIRINRRAARQ